MVVRRLTTPLLDRYRHHLEQTLESVPDHIAFIQDGNRRYARGNGDEPTEGHTAGAKQTQRVLQWCRDLGISTTTLYAFSTENFNRPAAERESLFDLFERKLRELADDDRIHEDRVAIRAIGATERLPQRVQTAIDIAEAATDTYDRYRVNIALAYGGRQQLLSAARTLAAAAADDDISPEHIDEQMIESVLYDHPMSDVDLLIRSGGEQRTSNFLPWHAVGAEAPVEFTDSCWPALSRFEFLRILHRYDHQHTSGSSSHSDPTVLPLRIASTLSTAVSRIN